MKKVYNLENRTYEFAKNVRMLFIGLKYNPLFENDIKQVIRSSGSVGANYIEANDKLSDKDFNHSIKIGKKETNELMWIFGAILRKRIKTDFLTFRIS